MLESRRYELRLPADWPPASVTVNGKAVPQSQPGQAGWSFMGNTLTTAIPTSSFSTAARVTIEVHRAPGLVARRGELDGFAGAMTRLRGAYDALQQTWPVAVPPDPLIDAMQTGDRLGYHPERAADEIAHFHEVLPQAQAAVTTLDSAFSQRLDDYARSAHGVLRPSDMEAAKQVRLASMARAVQLSNAASPAYAQQAGGASEVPAGVRTILTAKGEGVQIYSCMAVQDGAKWTLKGPDAKLLDAGGEAIGTHFAGPTWKLNDGSQVVGELVASRPSPDADSVAWLLLRAKAGSATGRLADVTYIRRTETQGGVPSANDCEKTPDVGKSVRVQYAATYTFYADRH
jgi:hypothetical protein